MRPTANRIPSLDGLRAIAIGLVLSCHVYEDTGIGDEMGIGYLFDIGNLGVRIFFVISGFLITSLLLQEWSRRQHVNLARFYFRRTFRIFPPFYAYIAIMLVLSQFHLAGLTLYSAVPAITYTSNYWSAGAGYALSHSWSLAVEEQFYLLWPLALSALGVRGAKWLLIATVVAGPVIRFFSERYGHFGGGGFHTNMDALAVGCLLAMLRSRLHESPIYCRLIRAAIPAGLVLGMVVAVNYQTDHPTLQNTIGTSFLNLGIGYLVDYAVTNRDSPVGKVLNCGPMVYLGTLSYSLYLWQQPFLHLQLTGPVLFLSGPARLIASPIVALACAGTAAAASYYLIERPSFALRDRLDRKIFPRRDNFENPISPSLHPTATALEKV